MEFRFSLPQKIYKVVIYCQTYNQHQYIEDALKGFVSQKTDFPFCAIVLDDCSTDGQQEIIKRYANEYPEIIIPVFLPYNHYSNGDNKDRYMRPWIEASEYMAMCEGDDYWTDEYKLQRQVDLLDSNKDCTLTYHACINVFVERFTGLRDCFGENVKTEYSCKEILKGYPFQTATVVCRSNFWLSDFCQKCLSELHYSSVMYFCASVVGRVIGINEKMSVYRRNDQGISNALHKGDRLVLFIEKWRKIAQYCSPEIARIVHSVTIANYLYDLSKNSPKQFRSLILNEFKEYPVTALTVMKRVARRKIVNTIKKIIRR